MTDNFHKNNSINKKTNANLATPSSTNTTMNGSTSQQEGNGANGTAAYSKDSNNNTNDSSVIIAEEDDMTSTTSSGGSSPRRLSPASLSESEFITKDSSRMLQQPDSQQQQQSAVTSPRATTTTSTSTTTTTTYSGAKGKSLRERSKIPTSFYASMLLIIGLQYFSGMYSLDTVQSWFNSILQSWNATYDILEYYKNTCQSIIPIGHNVGSNSGTAHEAAASTDTESSGDYLRATVISVLILSVSYVFLIAPFRAGLWTGPRSKKHKLHRYMGLAFMIQYSLAWVEFVTNYHDGARFSYMPHVIGLNGLIQSWSAFFSFKVLPELNDAGYYSDKAVLSRQFVHENAFFSLFSIFGSVYYRDQLRYGLRTSVGGRIIEYIFVFYPYILVRPLFPITRFSNAGSTQNGRSEKHRRFYEITTFSVKIFFLWAKYFLGFFINFMIFLDVVTEEQWKTIHGMFLLNVGTVSLAVFLHTLRFRKILPAPFTFSVYLLQIYATFSAIPMIVNMFLSHPKLCALVFSGLLANMTRSRKIHGVWCFVSMVLLTQTDIEW